jgi:hypothetical protein
VITSQWIDPRYTISTSEAELSVVGSLQRMSSTTSFTPMKMALFRTMLSSVGRSPRASHLIKGSIRRALMFGTRPVGLRFRRRVRYEPGLVTVVDEVKRARGGAVRLDGLQFGDEFAVRYVPQSRFFQFPDLEARGYMLTPAELERFHVKGQVSVERRVEITSGHVTVQVDGAPAEWAAPSIGSAAR